MMVLKNNFEKQFIKSPPRNYFAILGGEEQSEDWLCINPIVTNRPVWTPNKKIAIFSNLGLKKAKNLGEPLELICLSCFFHVLRKGNRIRDAILDDQYNLSILPWRAPCETTAIYRDKGPTYFIEGCRDSGIFWRNIKQGPTTEPPLLSCGALDTNGGCWYEECPHGAFFKDDVEPFGLF
jgi:hypothetical protein